MVNYDFAGVSQNTESGKVTFNPAYPWIYLSRDEFAKFAEKFTEYWKSLGKSKFKCDINFGECKLDQTCSSIRKEGLIQSFDFKARIGDEKSPIDITIKVPGEKMLIEGSRINYWLGDQQCFLSVFRNTADDNNIFGSVFMQNYYTVFDAETTPPSVGIASRAAIITVAVEEADNTPIVLPDDDDFDYNPFPDVPIFPQEEEIDKKDPYAFRFAIYAVVFLSLVTCGIYLVHLKCQESNRQKTFVSTE